jgi:hypothetical protein
MKNNLNWLPILALTCVVTLIPISYSHSSPKPFLSYMDDPWLTKSFCDSEHGQKFARSKVIAQIYLAIGDFIYESNDAKALSVNYGGIMRSKDTTSNKDLYESFQESVKKYNSNKEYALNIDNVNSAHRAQCYKEERKNNQPMEIYFEKCNAKVNSMIEAKHGNALVRFSCSLSIKGRVFPVLVDSKCGIKIGEKRLEGRYELTDISAFEETTIKQGIKRLLDEHAKNLSEVFKLTKMCK